jgi:hypothetical protein
VKRIVDPVYHTVRPAAGAVPVVERRPQLLADPAGIVEQWADDEFIGGKRHRFRQ